MVLRCKPVKCGVDITALTLWPGRLGAWEPREVFFPEPHCFGNVCSAEIPEQSQAVVPGTSPHASIGSQPFQSAR